MIELLNCDCMEYIPTCKDKQFDLAIVDPEFGINGHIQIGKKRGEVGDKWNSKWKDHKPTDGEYFSELFRISNNQIILGGNYFDLPPTRCFLIWDKVQRIDQSDCEFMWTSFETSARIFTYPRSNIQGFRNPNRFHPNEKPVKLYKWLLHNYAKEGDKIFDSHLGSGSIAIACHDMGFDLTGCEIDKDYFNAMMKRFNNHKLQQKLF